MPGLIAMKTVDGLALAFSHQTKIEQAISMVSQSASISVEKYSCNEKWMHFREPVLMHWEYKGQLQLVLPKSVVAHYNETTTSQSLGLYLRQRYIFLYYSHKTCNLEDPLFWNIIQNTKNESSATQALRNCKCRSDIHHCLILFPLKQLVAVSPLSKQAAS